MKFVLGLIIIISVSLLSGCTFDNTTEVLEQQNSNSNLITNNNIDNHLPAVNDKQQDLLFAPYLKVNDKIFNLEIAADAKTQAQGLSNRESLALDSGMLFIFQNYLIRNFWMNEMLFPLDIVWIKDNIVSDCAQNVQLTTNNKVTRLSSPEPVNYVLEINAGLCQKYNIKSGTKVDINLQKR